MQVACPAEHQSAAAVPSRAHALMSVRGLGIRFRTSQGVWQATRGIDVDGAPCERVAIVGESGCGNSITGLSILRLLPINLAGLDGSIMVDGVDLASCNTAAMRDVCARAGNPGGFAGVQRGRRILTHRARSDHEGSLMAGRILS